MFDFEFFDMGLDRMGTATEKWDVARKEHGADLLPMWVADMDFSSPPAVQAALLKRAAHPTYGYTELTEADDEAFIAFWQRRHGLEINRDELVHLPCVVTGIKACIQAFSEKGDGVVIQPPVYGPFFSAIEKLDRRLMESPLVQGEDRRFHMNFDKLEAHFVSGAKIMLLCSPHNPVSRVWSAEEMQRLTALCEKYNVVLVADEIHADFVFTPAAFVPALETESKQIISLCAASKTFNLAGLQQACLITKNRDFKQKVQRVLDATGVRSGNIFALEGTRAAYNEGDAWLDGLMAYLDKGREILKAELERELPKVELVPIEATYLAFADMRAYGYTCEEMTKRCLDKKVMFTEGTFFSEELGEGFLRINFACPHRFISEGIKRLKSALI